MSLDPPPALLDLLGKSAVVTGSTRGIGLAIATRLAAHGARVLLHGRSDQAPREVLERFAALGQDAAYHAADIGQPAARESLVDFAWAWQPRIDIWINNAGADVLTGAAANWTFDRKLEELWRTDVVGTISLSRAVGERLRGQSSGVPAVILNMGWDQAEIGMEGDSGEMFAASKGAIMAFTRSLARSLSPSVRVNCLAPGWIRTAWGEEAPEYWQRRARRESLRDRWGTPEDVAAAAHYLVSPAADFITGHVLPVNGGLRMGTSGERHGG